MALDPLVSEIAMEDEIVETIMNVKNSTSRMFFLTIGGLAAKACPFPAMCYVSLLKYIAVQQPFYYHRMSKIEISGED